MELVLAIVIGSLFATALYTILRRSIIRLAIGLVLIGHAANLLIFAGAGLTRDGPPILPPGGVPVPPNGEPGLGDPTAVAISDPLPQALILTAIVIGFAVLAFTLVLVHRVYTVVRSDDVDHLSVTDQLPDVRGLEKPPITAPAGSQVPPAEVGHDPAGVPVPPDAAGTPGDDPAVRETEGTGFGGEGTESGGEERP
jgi:multicomponent Na+:H+ antiporter subunit C